MSGLSKIHQCPSCGELRSKNAFGVFVNTSKGINKITSYSEFCGDCRKLENKGKLSFLNKVIPKKQLSKFIYIIHASNTSTYKIGIAKDVEKRLKGLQTSNPNKLQVVNKFYFDNASKIESDLHEKFKDKRLNGEWFNLNVCDLYNVVKTIKTT